MGTSLFVCLFLKEEQILSVFVLAPKFNDSVTHICPLSKSQLHSKLNEPIVDYKWISIHLAFKEKASLTCSRVTVISLMANHLCQRSGAAA